MCNLNTLPQYIWYRHPILFLDTSPTDKENLFFDRVNCSVVRLTPYRLLTIPPSDLKRKTIYYLQETPKDMFTLLRKLQQSRKQEPDYKLIGNISENDTFSLDLFLQTCHAILKEKTDIELWLKAFRSANHYKFYLDPDLHFDVLNAVRWLTRPQTLEGNAYELIVKEEQANKVFTASELRVFYQLIAGKSNKEIAKCLYMSDNTVKNHIYNMNKKLDSSSKTHLIKRAREEGWLIVQPKNET